MSHFFVLLLTLWSLNAAASGLIDNAFFAPGPDSRPALHSFNGRIEFSEHEMNSEPSPIAPTFILLMKDPQKFPHFQAHFFTHGQDLVPVEREIIAPTSGDSYWEVILSPGKIWSEKENGGLSRGAFPFVMMNSIEGESHHGLATFTFDGQKISSVRYQIVNQTAPYLVPEFVAWGEAPAQFTAGSPFEFFGARLRYIAEQNARWPIRSIDELLRQKGLDPKLAEKLEEGLERDEVIVSGLIIDGQIYTNSCRSVAGPLPYCENQRFGVWSVSKSIAGTLSLLRMGKKFGTNVYSTKLLSVLEKDAAPSHWLPGNLEAWKDVEIQHLINMSSGIGSGSTKSDPNDIDDGYAEENDWAWNFYYAKSAHEKAVASLEEPAYPWGPGKVARYRDQDPFLASMALDHILKKRKGEKAELWSMMLDEVLRPIGISHLPHAHTIESDGSKGVPMMAYGTYPTLEEIGKISRLLMEDPQGLLEPNLRAQLMDRSCQRGLLTGYVYPAGEATYDFGLWRMPFHTLAGEQIWIPTMSGWGGIKVALLPGNVVGFRIGRTMADRPAIWDITSMAQLAERLR